jgi:hypothetical protein
MILQEYIDKKICPYCESYIPNVKNVYYNHLYCSNNESHIKLMYVQNDLVLIRLNNFQIETWLKPCKVDLRLNRKRINYFNITQYDLKTLNKKLQILKTFS